MKSVGNLELLTELPFDLKELPEIEGKAYIEKEIFNFYLNKSSNEIENQKQKNLEKVRSEFEEQVSKFDEQKKELEQRVDDLQETEGGLDLTINDLKVKQESISTDIKQADKELMHKGIELKELTQTYKDRKNRMENNLNRLNTFIREKAKKLSKLELVSDSDLSRLLGEMKAQNSGKEMVDFHEDLNGDFNQAIKHIQAYLYKKDIYYKQDLLKDFFALLRTNDLIILAGDSGSGKSNLVKSMADAIGGISVILPVKPNWTGAEDLLGYYNPLEKKFLTTLFLDTLIEASHNPDVPYLICLDEMNLARVEYYFSDFLSLLEERSKIPDIYLYSDSEASHTLSEFKTFLQLIDEVRIRNGKESIEDFIGLLKNEDTNLALHKICGFHEGDSLLKYHSQLRRILSGFINTPSSILLPENVRIIGAINVDETTHYLSPKILDRAHVIRFTNPLLYDWESIEQEVDTSIDALHPIKFEIQDLGVRKEYPKFDRENEFAKVIIEITKKFLDKLGVEFGLRTIRQALNYYQEFSHFENNDKIILNNFILHKVLPKMMFDGEKAVGEVAKKDILISLKNYLEQQLSMLSHLDNIELCINEFDRVIENAKSNDWVVNYWSR